MKFLFLIFPLFLKYLEKEICFKFFMENSMYKKFVYIRVENINFIRSSCVVTYSLWLPIYAMLPTSETLNFTTYANIFFHPLTNTYVAFQHENNDNRLERKIPRCQYCCQTSNCSPPPQKNPHFLQINTFFQIRSLITKNGDTSSICNLRLSR